MNDKLEHNHLMKHIKFNNNRFKINEMMGTLGTQFRITDSDDEVHLMWIDGDDAEKTFEFLNSNYFINKKNREMLRIWHQYGEFSHLEEYLKDKLPNMTLNLWHLRSADDVLKFAITSGAPISLKSVVALLGLFPNEFEFEVRDTYHTVILSIKIYEIEKNNKMLNFIDLGEC